MDNDKIRRRIARILMRLEDAATLALEAQNSGASPTECLQNIYQIDALLDISKLDCATARRAIDKLIRNQSN